MGQFGWTRREIPGVEFMPEIGGLPAETIDQAVERVLHVAGEYLDRVASRFFAEGARTSVVIAEHPAEAIIEYARDQRVDMIAMATHGRSGFARLLMGSVANDLVRSGVAPLFLVRPDKLHLEDKEPDLYC